MCAPTPRASSDMTAGILPGPYRMPAYRAVGHFRLTNKTPAATYRAPGRFETHVRARAPDRRHRGATRDRRASKCAAAISIAADEMPFDRPLEALGEEIVLRFRRLCRPAGKAACGARTGTSCKAELARRRAAGEAGRRRRCACSSRRAASVPTDGVRIEVDTTGTVEVITGGASLGQGFETVMAQVCAEALGVDYRNVRVIHGQTDRIEFGIGAHASRATVMTASATHNRGIEIACEGARRGGAS